MKSNENEITTHRYGSFTVPFTMTIKTIVISNQDCFDGGWNSLIKITRGYLNITYKYQSYLLNVSAFSNDSRLNLDLFSVV